MKKFDLYGNLNIYGTKPLPKRKQINKGLRNQVWEKYMGRKSSGKCFCCGINTIYFNEFQVGHNKAVAKGGKNHISNLRPICGGCNRGMRTMSIEQYKRKHFGIGRKTRSDKGTKKAKKSASLFPSFKDLTRGIQK
ncbi:MAG: HNH endonuclease signature motif containing protein [archaeon]|nr:HNH endonuclease signature motif containing protein [archaeon]